jgi:hypothetical protein
MRKQQERSRTAGKLLCPVMRHGFCCSRELFGLWLGAPVFAAAPLNRLNRSGRVSKLTHQASIACVRLRRSTGSIGLVA